MNTNLDNDLTFEEDTTDLDQEVDQEDQQQPSPEDSPEDAQESQDNQEGDDEAPGDESEQESENDTADDAENKADDGTEKSQAEQDIDQKIEFNEEQQKHIDSIISRKSTKHKLEMHEFKQQLERANADLKTAQAYIKQENERNKQLNERLKSDDMVDDQTMQLAQQNQAPEFQQQQAQYVQPQQGIRMFNHQKSVHENNNESIHIRNSYETKYPNNVPQMLNSINTLIQSGLPHDTIALIAHHPNTADIMHKLVTDDDFSSQLKLAGYESGSLNDYSLKFNELTSKLKVNSSVPPKIKPRPNKPLESRRSAAQNRDEDTVYID